jgi:hypothetical protein
MDLRKNGYGDQLASDIAGLITEQLRPRLLKVTQTQGPQTERRVTRNLSKHCSATDSNAVNNEPGNDDRYRCRVYCATCIPLSIRNMTLTGMIVWHKADPRSGARAQ